MEQPAGPRGVQVLQIQRIRMIQHYEGEAVELAKGDLQVLLVTIDVEDPTRSPKLHASEKLGEDYSTDLWLVLKIGEFSLPIKASQRIEPKRSHSSEETSYVFPSSDISNLSMELFVSATSNPLGLLTEFEDLLSDYCAFVSDDSKDAGQIEVMNKDGQIIGTVISKRIREDPGLSIKGHEKDPVLLELPPQEMQMEKGSEISGGTITARRAPLNTESKIDWIVVGAQYVSAGIVKGSTLVAKGMTTAAENYTSKSKPAEEPIVFSPTSTELPSFNRSTSNYASQSSSSSPSQPQGSQALSSLNKYSGSAVQLSKKTTSVILNAASGVGGSIGRAAGIQPKKNPDGSEGPPPKGFRGVINRSLIAASVVLDGIDQGAQNLIESGGEASSKVIGHKYGNEARITAGHGAGTARNLFLIYKDVSGIRRKCLLKMAGGTFKVRLTNGQEVDMALNDLSPDAQQQLQQGQSNNASSSAILPPPTYSGSRSGSSTPNKEKW